MSFFRDLTSKPKLKCNQITFSFKLNGLVGEELKINFTKSKFYCLSKNERKLSYLNWKYTFCSHSAGLLLVDLDDIVLLHLERLRSFIIIDSAAVEEKPGNKEELWALQLQGGVWFTWEMWWGLQLSQRRTSSACPSEWSASLWSGSHCCPGRQPSAWCTRYLLPLLMTGEVSGSSQDGDLLVTEWSRQSGWLQLDAALTLEKAGPELRRQLISSAGARSLSPRTPSGGLASNF